MAKADAEDKGRGLANYLTPLIVEARQEENEVRQRRSLVANWHIVCIDTNRHPVGAR
jgi:hypothetical protein